MVFRIFQKLCLPSTVALALLAGCGGGSEEGADEKPPAPVEPGPSTPETSQATPEKPKPPVVYTEELDQYQEYFKEQHDTSFGYSRKKNWMSFTAGKEGLLTRIALYGKPHFATSNFYGSEMSGFIRAGNPDRGTKLAEWSLSREDVVKQLAKRGVSELDYGWIDVFMLGEAVMEVGKTYYMVCDHISDGKLWFGAFSFSEGDSYKGGRHWLHPEHDLVFRTYVGQSENPVNPKKPEPEDNGTGTPTPPGPAQTPHQPGNPIPQKPKAPPAPLITPATPVTPIQPPPDPPPPDPGKALLPPGDPPAQPPAPAEQPTPNPATPEQPKPNPAPTEGAKPVPAEQPKPEEPAAPAPKATEENATSDKNETKRKGIFRNLFRRKR